MQSSSLVVLLVGCGRACFSDLDGEGQYVSDHVPTSEEEECLRALPGDGVVVTVDGPPSAAASAPHW